MRAMSELPPTPNASSSSDHRRRLLAGMAQAVAHKGYGDTTIADIVREAGVSRRTFYEHFASKAECLLALYVSASEGGLRVLQQAINPGQPWHQQVEQALTAYLGSLASNPVLLRTLFVDILGLGPEGLVVRRAMHERMADFIVSVVAAGGVLTPGPHTRVLAVALVGGVHELVLQAIEDQRGGDLLALVAPCSELVRAILDRPEVAQRSAQVPA